jgi:hypothetical protein
MALRIYARDHFRGVFLALDAHHLGFAELPLAEARQDSRDSIPQRHAF